MTAPLLELRELRIASAGEAAELARQVSHALGIAWSGRHLVRHGNRAQHTLQRSRRKLNVRHAFACGRPVPDRNFADSGFFHGQIQGVAVSGRAHLGEHRLLSVGQRAGKAPYDAVVV